MSRTHTSTLCPHSHRTSLQAVQGFAGAQPSGYGETPRRYPTATTRQDTLPTSTT